jgi:hypothetical protein
VWTDDERRRLRNRFQRGLYWVLQAVGKWARLGEDGGSVAAVKALADRLEAAGADLDVCAANCHALATTLRSQLGVDGTQRASVQAGVRLSRALGSPVVLTYTTIQQLAGKMLRLEYIEGANAIVQVDGEYWGTPLDRVLVLQDPADASPESGAPTAEELAPGAAPAFTFALRRGELSNAVQFLAMTGRTGVLKVTSETPTAQGYLLFDARRVKHAEFGSYVDVDAVARMMNLELSRAVFCDGDPGASTTMQLPADQLLIEAAVRADELVL